MRGANVKNENNKIVWNLSPSAWHIHNNVVTSKPAYFLESNILVDYISWSIWMWAFLLSIDFNAEFVCLHFDYLANTVRVPHGGNREVTLNTWVHHSTWRTFHSMLHLLNIIFEVPSLCLGSVLFVRSLQCHNVYSRRNAKALICFFFDWIENKSISKYSLPIFERCVVQRPVLVSHIGFYRFYLF